MKKRIGISYTTTNFENYRNWLAEEVARGEVELITLSFVENNVSAIQDCDGFILTGGIDIDAGLYGGDTNYPHQPKEYQSARDHFESVIYRHAREKSLPVLGICRGMQLINVLEGGKLIQDLGQGNALHKKNGDEDRSHAVELAEGSLLQEVCGIAQGRVNSAHHQAVSGNALGKNLVANAWSPDGVIEGIEFADRSGKPFVLGIQWHPERMPERQYDPLSQNLKTYFLQQVKP